MLILLSILCLLQLIVIALLIYYRPRPNRNIFSLSTRLDELDKTVDKLCVTLREDFTTNRHESATLAAQSRQELTAALNQFRKEMTDTLHLITEGNRLTAEGINKTVEERLRLLTNKIEENNWRARETLTANLKAFSAEQKAATDELKREQKEMGDRAITQLESITAKVEEKLHAVNEQAKSDGHLMRQTLEASFKGFRETFTQSVDAINTVQREKFAQLETKQGELVQKTEEKLEGIQTTVDEKLQKTLHERLGHSFE
ncbi:MAG: hypothetical protein ICV51_03435, partial [Flavisolibacter sp.]|nr:hypothetical protein [Flavisolibacter sp.]